jgi:hypothetical protein
MGTEPVDKPQMDEQQPAYRIDIKGIEGDADGGSSERSLRARRWVGIHFDCCSVYTRVYRNAEGTAYHGACPRCGRPVTLRVGPDGTDARFFVAE